MKNLAGNGGCGGMVSVMLVSIVTLTIFFAVPASAKKAPSPPVKEAPATHVCQAPDTLIEKFTATDATLVEDLKGEALKKFNDAYTADTGGAAPDLDRLTVFTSKANPDTEVYLIVGSRGDCVIGAQPLPKKVFNAARHPGTGI